MTPALSLSANNGANAAPCWASVPLNDVQNEARRFEGCRRTGRQRARDSPLGDEVYKLGGETVGGQLRRRLVHHLLELLERGSPRVVGEFQNGQLDLEDREDLTRRFVHGRARGQSYRASTSTCNTKSNTVQISLIM